MVHLMFFTVYKMDPYSTLVLRQYQSTITMLFLLLYNTTVNTSVFFLLLYLCTLCVSQCVFACQCVSVCFLAHGGGEDDDAQHVHALTGSRLGAHHHVGRRRQVQPEVTDVAAVLAAAAVVLEVVNERATGHARALRCPRCLHHRYAVGAILRHTRDPESE